MTQPIEPCLEFNPEGCPHGICMRANGSFCRCRQNPKYLKLTPEQVALVRWPDTPFLTHELLINSLPNSWIFDLEAIAIRAIRYALQDLMEGE